MKQLLLILSLLAGSYSFGAIWTQKSDFGGEARHRTTMLTIGNKIYAGLGHYNGAGPNILFDDWWEYDPSTNAWTQKADYLGGICYHAAGFTIDDIGYVGTGRISPSGSVLVKDFFKYDATNNTWTQLTDFPGSGRRGAVGFAIGEYGYIGTGSSSQDMYRYHPPTDSWTQVANVPGGARMSAIGFSLDGYGYVGTGYRYSQGWSSTDFYKYDPTTDTWTPIADVGIDPLNGPRPRMESTGFGLNGKGYVITGVTISSGDNYKDFWEYDPSLDQWIELEEFPGTARRYMSATTLNGFAYVGLGTNGTNFKDFWRYDLALSVIEKSIDQIAVQAFPNPASDHVNISIENFPDVSPKNLSIQIHNLVGQKVYDEKVVLGDNRIETQNWQNGQYIYSIAYNDSPIKTGKIIVNK
ncbi:MAG: T9SS type A sorting domain-containing protein [bacterium]|nr:T9SS type A sorting domain-containing protein [bacterium]